VGLSLEMTRFLLAAHKQGVRFDETLTLGRQHMPTGPKRLEKLLKEAGCWPPPQEEAAFRVELAAAAWRFEVFGRRLGVKRLVACDASDFEGAGIVHDLNQPVPAELEQKFDVVIDGGTLEHVFNFPVAVANCMKMIRVGGHFIASTPANNYCGHGFYQFSPELFFRVFSEANGFRMVRCAALAESVYLARLFGLAYPFEVRGPVHEVSDPAAVGERVTLINHAPSALMILAQKVAHMTPFERTPQQSDYSEQWQKGESVSPLQAMRQGSRLEGWLRSWLSEDVCREVLPRLAGVLDPFRSWRFRRANSFSNRRFYRRTER